MAKPTNFAPYSVNSVKQEILLFIPFAGIWPHSQSEARLVELLPASKFNLELLTCGELFPNFCTVMESRGIPLVGASMEKKATCSECVSNARLLERHLSPSTQLQFLADLFFPNDQAIVTSAISTVSHTNFQDFCFRGLPIGRIAAYEALIKYKKISLNFNKNEWEYFIENLENCIRVVLAGERYFQIKRPSAVLCYSPQYGVTGTFAALAEREGLKTYFVEGSANVAEKYSAVRIWGWRKYKLLNPALHHWTTSDSVTEVSSNERRRISRHFREISKARSHDVYSTRGRGLSTRKHFSVGDRQKLFLLTTSSYDEVYSGAHIGGYPARRHISDVYMNQSDWLLETIKWARDNPDVFLIIRLHPRDLPNKRESVLAEQTLNWESTLSSLPQNVAVDYPDGGFAFDDHLKEIDLLITGWSSTALEAMAHGIPVVTYDGNLPRFPASIHITGRSKKQYIENLNESKFLTRDLEIREQMYRWLAFSFCRGTIQLSGRLIDRKFSLRTPTLHRALILFAHFFPKLSRRLDLLLPPVEADAARLAALLESKQDSLFE